MAHTKCKKRKKKKLFFGIDTEIVSTGEQKKEKGDK